MCGRYTLRTPLTVLAQQFLFDLGGVPLESIRPRYNVAPTQDVVAVRQREAGSRRELAILQWGLIPSWAKDPKIGSSMINARAETLAEKPAFRSAFAKRRCLVLADGFYEWKKEGKQKIPYYFQLDDERPFAFAGLWECWRGAKVESVSGASEPLESCTIVTTTANELCAPYHDRMPVILSPADYDMWLDPSLKDTQRLVGLLSPLPASEMRSRPVSTRVNNVRNDDEGVMHPEQALFD